MLGRWWGAGERDLKHHSEGVQIHSSNPLKFYGCCTPEEKYQKNANFISILGFFKVGTYAKTWVAKTWISKSQIHRGYKGEIHKTIFFFRISWQLHLRSMSFWHCILLLKACVFINYIIGCLSPASGYLPPVNLYGLPSYTFSVSTSIVSSCCGIGLNHILLIIVFHKLPPVLNAFCVHIQKPLCSRNFSASTWSVEDRSDARITCTEPETFLPHTL